MDGYSLLIVNNIVSYSVNYPVPWPCRRCNHSSKVYVYVMYVMSTLHTDWGSIPDMGRVFLLFATASSRLWGPHSLLSVEYRPGREADLSPPSNAHTSS